MLSGVRDIRAISSQDNPELATSFEVCMPYFWGLFGVMYNTGPAELPNTSKPTEGHPSSTLARKNPPVGPTSARRDLQRPSFAYSAA